jgi:molybdenum cofactor cytidylyltransferase
MSLGIGGVILAAGESSRMGRDKALLPWPKDVGTPSGGGTILSFAIKSLSSYCDFVIVVGGKNEDALRQVVYGCGAFLVRNPTPERGQFSSLQTGLRQVLNRGRDSAMVTLVDRPAPNAETLSQLVNAFVTRRHGIWATIPDYQGRHGHPIMIGREMIEEFLTAAPTANARDIEHANQSRISYLPVGDLQVITNADTPQDYASLESKP